MAGVLLLAPNEDMIAVVAAVVLVVVVVAKREFVRRQTIYVGE